MKLTRKILPAIAMLVISAVMLSTASYAWFAMNSTATAEGMQVKVQSNSVFLYIGNATQNISDIQSGKQVKVTAAATTSTDFMVFPSAYKKTETPVKNASETDLGLGTDSIKGTAIGTASNWYTAEATAVDSSGAKENSGKALTDFEDYVVKYSFNLTLAVGSNPVAAEQLTVNYNPTIKTDTTATGSDTAAAVRVIVVCGDKFEEFSGVTSKTGTVKLNANQITSDAATQVDVYVYYDGNDSSVYTNNIANLEGVNFTLDFNIGTTT